MSKSGKNEDKGIGRLLSNIALCMASLGSPVLTAATLILYVDVETNQVYTTPGKNRVKLGEFEQVKRDENSASK
ncbi:hypothetical protein [Nitrosomonas sp.]|uniref:hypothetical protein n=1 Tax=Nitrosomonas sp. TaxID=42353 RepID=UPI0026365EAC|nr:hypothetical protein [Nitrosomonas sp.]MCW5602792.1 hypothetical protein [Nitrosomonas sp.]